MTFDLVKDHQRTRDLLRPNICWKKKDSKEESDQSEDKEDVGNCENRIWDPRGKKKRKGKKRNLLP